VQIQQAGQDHPPVAWTRTLGAAGLDGLDLVAGADTT
jgi:hypothetical protein